MVEPIQNIINELILTVAGLYHRLILLVGESGSGKTSALHGVAKQHDAEIFNLNLNLSYLLLELTMKQRVLQLSTLLEDILKESQGIIFLDNIEILFDKDLKQDPLRLLQNLSRNRLIIASWNGRYQGKKLIYAEPDHPEYRLYDSIETVIVCMNGTTTIDIDKSLN
ncbi:MAG: BREX-3 system P-loop-containing protein BrxF [Desulfamplus sp.]|nr:BREX-3 system P-loop-containing protein BrxF [Desulfamplus sp.]